MLPRWRRVYSLCATIVILLVYLKTSTGQTATDTSFTVISSEGNTFVTAVAITTLEPTTSLPNLAEPGNVQLTELSSDNTAFNVSWNDKQDRRLSVTYDIIVNTTDGSESKKFNDTTSPYTVTGRTPGQEYDVTVVAVDDENSRVKPSDEKTIRLKPNIVNNLTLVDSSTTSITVKWDEPLDSVFDSYTINCSTGTPNLMMIPRNGTLEASCDGVTPGTIETTEVTVVSGSRSNSDTISNRVKPNTVQGLEGSTVSTTSVSVTWNPPSDPEEDSYYYTVNCSQGDAVPDNITDGTTTKATCSPVTAGSLVTVTVTTYIGSESNANSTMVRAQPNSVGELDEETATINSVTASWQKPDGIVSEYNIECSHGDSRNFVVTDDGNSTKYSATCPLIPTPGTECTVTVTSVSDNVRGDGRSVKITAVPVPPKLIETASTETSISVEWKKPESVVDYYIVDCSNGTESSSNITAVNGTHFASCTGLEVPGDRYNISVQSQSNDKLSAATTKSIYALPDSVMLVEDSPSVDTVSASWERPDGVFDLFTVQCGPSGNATALFEEILYDPDATSYEAVCNVSIPGDLYTMTVVSSSGNQESNSSTIQLRALPEAVGNFTVVDVTTTTAELQWTVKDECQDGGCVWSSFNLSRDEDIDEQNVDRNRNSTFFKSLKPGQNYTFTIIVLSGDEESSPVYVIDRTKPNIVENLRLLDSLTTSVKVEWDEPLDSVFDSYTINCSTGTPNPMMIPKGEMLEASCDGVTPGTIETTEVTVVSGSRSNSAAISNRVKPNTVRSLEGSTVNTTSVSVTWNPPSDPEEDSYYYTVNCSEGIAVPDNITDGTTTEATCSPVTAGSLVTVTVTTFSGTESNTVSTMVRAQPNSVDALEEGNATTDSVTALWQKPNGDVSEYIISCSHGSPEQAVIRDDGIPTKYNATCVNILVPGTECTMTVTSISDNVRGDGRSVKITAVPIPPELIGTASTETSISVKWQKPNSVVDYYIVECSDGMESSSNITVENGTQTASCIGLEDPGDRYDISVWSQSNDKLSAATTKSINALPDSVRLVKGPSSVDIVSATWERPDGVFDEFTVWCTPADIATPEEEEVLFDPDATSYGADCIVSIPGNLYNMTVVSSSGNQNSSSSSLPLRALPEAVKEFTVENVTTDMVDLQWEMKDQCSNVGSCIWTSFNVSHEPNFVQQSIDEDERSTSFTKLTPGEKYTFSIIVLSGEEQSSPVNVSERTIPESVDEFNVSLYSTDFVELYWTIKAMCYNSRCVWDSYNLTYTSDRNSEEQSIPPLDRNTETANVTGLIPGENYNFSIIGVSAEKGSSPVSFVQRTIPETVDKFEVVSYGTETVNLRWTTKAMCEGSQCVWDLYRISYVSFSGTVGKPLEEPMNSSSIKITDLTPGESYDFSITVYSGAEESEDKMVTQRTLPEAVESFTVDNYTDYAVYLSWTMTQKCKNSGCEWTAYEIRYSSTEISNIAKDKRTATVDPLIPGEEYTFRIAVISFKEYSTFRNTTQRLRPASVESVEKQNVRQRTATVQWARPPGNITNYITTITSLEDGRGGDEEGGFDGNLEEEIHTATFTGLTSGLEYEITVCTVSVNQTCITPAKIIIETLPDEPSEPRGLNLEATDIRTVIVTFEEPKLPNGDITKYIIRYSGVMSGSLDQEEKNQSYTPDGQSPYSVTVNNLVPGYTYTFKVGAVNSAGEGPEATDTIELGQLKPENSTAPPEDIVVGVKINVRGFILMFPPDWFSDCNGQLKNYSVFVVEKGGNEDISNPPMSYSDVQGQKPLSVYLAIANETYPFPPDYSSCESRRKKRQTPSSIPVKIGDGTCSDDGKYCNDELHGNREYKVRFRACNDAGCSDTEYSVLIKTDLNNLSWVLPLVFILLILICAAALFIVWKERQQPGSMTKYIKRPKGIDNRGFEHDKPMRRQGDRRPVKLVEFGNFLEDMSRDSDYLFSEEYNDLRPVGKNQSTDAAQLEVNRVKNRFSNILPYDHTRVTLSPIDDEEGTDYINANYMLGYRSQREYVACQGPLQSTEEDMWRLVWEQGASIIVMVTQLMENGKIKCHQYWPDEGEGPVRYGDVVVNPGEVEKKELWTIRKFQITKGPHTRKITHFNFIAWPDHGVPEKPDDLIKFVRTVREYKPNDGKPTVVHCSAGVGRTGTFISLDHLMSAMEDKDEVDIFGMVRSMRMNRCMMVQTESQYIFIHQCVMALIEGSSEDDAVYENVNGGTKGYFNEALI